jgi:hypothetical protein
MQSLQPTVSRPARLSLFSFLLSRRFSIYVEVDAGQLVAFLLGAIGECAALYGTDSRSSRL